MRSILAAVLCLCACEKAKPPRFEGPMPVRFFSDRTDIEIAGDDDVSYADVVAAIDAASAAGFTDWQITDPQGLTARPSL